MKSENLRLRPLTVMPFYVRGQKDIGHDRYWTSNLLQYLGFDTEIGIWKIDFLIFSF